MLLFLEQAALWRVSEQWDWWNLRCASSAVHPWLLGCFTLLHYTHVHSLKAAGDRVINPSIAQLNIAVVLWLLMANIEWNPTGSQECCHLTTSVRPPCDTSDRSKLRLYITGPRSNGIDAFRASPRIFQFAGALLLHVPGNPETLGSAFHWPVGCLLCPETAVAKESANRSVPRNIKR